MRILLNLGASTEAVRDAVMEGLSAGGVRRRDARPAQQSVRQTSAGQAAIDPAWLGGLPPLLGPLGHEIRSALGRSPDVGDLLLACACVPHTPAAEAFEQLGIDLDQLWSLLEHARARAASDRQDLADRMRRTATAKDEAIRDGRHAEAAHLRDQERELRETVEAHPRAQLASFDELRHRLGLPNPAKP